MVRISSCFFVVVLVLLSIRETSSQLGSGPHITDVNILLPPRMKNPVEYRLQGSDGCFKWYFFSSAETVVSTNLVKESLPFLAM